MKILQCILLAFVLIVPPTTAHSTPNKTVDAPEEIAGAIGSYLPVVAQSRQETWTMIKIVTGQFSGCATPSGLAHISGSYSVIQPLGAAVANASGTYSWDEPSALLQTTSLPGRPSPQLSRWLASTLFAYQSDGKMPQSATRYVLCLLHEKTPGQDKFTDVHLIPDAWQNDLPPAVLYLRAHPELSNFNSTATNWVQVRQLLHNSNPYLVLTALQLLAASKNLMPDDMSIALTSSDTNIIACSIVISSLYSWSDLDTNAKWFVSQISAIKSINQLEGIAFGIFASTPFTTMMYPSSTDDLPNLPDTSKSPKPQNINKVASTMALVRKKLKQIDQNGGDDQWRTIDSICRMFGV